MEPSCLNKTIILIILNKTMADAFKVNKLIKQIVKGNLEKRKLQAQDLPI